MMLRRFLPFIVLPLLALSAWLGLNTNPAQAQTAQDVCFARWVWNTDERDFVFWEAPFQANLTGLLDLRSNTQAGQSGPIAEGFGLFAYDQPMGSTGMHCMGGDLDQAITAVQADTIALLLDRSAGSIAARNIRGLLKEVLTTDADPTGVNLNKPVRISRKQGFIIHLGGYGPIIQERFSESHPAFQVTLAVRRADYTRNREAGVPLEALQRWTGHDALAIFGREPTPADLDLLLPAQYRADSWQKPRTIITESFNQANSTILGPDLTWTEVTSNWTTVSNEAAPGGVAGNARAEHDLSSDDHYAQVVIKATTSSNAGVRIRFAAAADTNYFGIWRNTNTRYEIFKRIATSNTILFNGAASAIAINDVIKLEVTGADLLTLYRNAGAEASGTDTSITGDLRTGMYGDSSTSRLDDFEAADLAAARRVIHIR